MRFLKAAAIPLILAVAGVLFVIVGRTMPAYTDEAAYRTAVEVASNRANDTHATDTGPLSEAFFAARHRYETAKWPVTDTGYSLLAWTALVGAWRIAAQGRPFSALVRSAGTWPGLLALTIMGLAMLAVGDWEFEMRQLAREQLPWWADSIVIGIVEGWILLAILAPLVVALAVGPALGRRCEPRNILVFAGGPTPRNILVSLLYALPVLLFAYLAVQIFEPGGWAASTGAAILCWLLLNGRALLAEGAQAPAVVAPAMVRS